jgi:hypothetical protein
MNVILPHCTKNCPAVDLEYPRVSKYPNSLQIERMRHEREKERQQRLKQAQTCRLVGGTFSQVIPTF